MPAASKKGAGGKALALRPHPPTKAAGDGGGGPTTTLLNHAPTALARHTPATVGFTVAAERQQEHDISVAMAAPLAPPSDSSDDAATATYLAQRGLGTLAEGGVGGAGGGRPSAKDALRDFDEATKLDPTLSMAYYGRGSYYISLEQYEEAAQQLDEAVRLNALDAMAWFSRGEVHRILGRHQLALRDLDEAIRLDAGNEMAFRGRAEVHIADGHFAEAITDLQEALDIEPSLHDLAARRIADIECQIKDAQVKGLIEAGVAFMQLGKDTEALARLHEAVEVRPDCAEAYSSMGTLFHKGGQLEEALEYHERARALEPSYGGAYFGCAQVRHSQECYKEALEDYEAALRMRPDMAWQIEPYVDDVKEKIKARALEAEAELLAALDEEEKALEQKASKNKKKKQKQRDKKKKVEEEKRKRAEEQAARRLAEEEAREKERQAEQERQKAARAQRKAEAEARAQAEATAKKVSAKPTPEPEQGGAASKEQPAARGRRGPKMATAAAAAERALKAGLQLQVQLNGGISFRDEQKGSSSATGSAVDGGVATGSSAEDEGDGFARLMRQMGYDGGFDFEEDEEIAGESLLTAEEIEEARQMVEAAERQRKTGAVG